MKKDIKIIKLNRLNPDLALKISNLNNICNKYDNSDYEIFTDYELNSTVSDCFYMCYDKNELVGTLTAFIPDSHECWLYAATLPEYRNSKIFSKLLSEFKAENDYKITFPLSKQSKNEMLILNHYGFNMVEVEYIMKYDLLLNSDSILKINNLVLELEYEENEFSLWIGNSYIGGCMVHFNNSTVTIYEFAINDEYQGKGFGKLGLRLILNQLLYEHYSSVILQVSGQNKKACNLYKSLGFDTISTEYFIKSL